MSEPVHAPLRKGKVIFRIYSAGLGYHPDAPPGTLLVHPASLPLFGGFIVEGDLVRTSGSPHILELLTSDLAFPPILKRGNTFVVPSSPLETQELTKNGYTAIFSGGFLIHSEKFIPPIRFRWEDFQKIVAAFKKEEFDPSLYYLGIPNNEKYLQHVGPFFGYHVPNAVQEVDEKDPRELVREWSGSTLFPRPFVDIALVEHRDYGVEETGVHGHYPLRTPYPARACEEGHVSPLGTCPICGKPTSPARVCPLCGRVYPPDVERCEVDRSPLLSTTTFDPTPVLERVKAEQGDIGEVVIADGRPEHPLLAYLRKKSNLVVGPRGFVEMRGSVFPGEKNNVPRVLVGPILRIYRFITLVEEQLRGEKVSYPTHPSSLVGRKLVLVSGNIGWEITIESVGGERLTLRKELFYALPRKDVKIAVLEDVLLAGTVEVKKLEGGRPFPYVPTPSRSLFEGEMKVERLLELYLSTVEVMGADPSRAVPLLHPLLKEREGKLLRTPLYRCESCGAVYPRIPLSGKCPRCGGKVRGEEVEGVTIDDLLERFSKNVHVASYLALFKRRFGGKRKQKSIVELF